MPRMGPSDNYETYFLDLRVLLNVIVFDFNEDENTCKPLTNGSACLVV